MSAGQVIADAILRTERDLFLTELERMVATEFNAHHDDTEWDRVDAIARFEYSTQAFGLDMRAAHHVAHLVKPTPTATGDCVYCGHGSGIRCCAQARDH